MQVLAEAVAGLIDFRRSTSDEGSFKPYLSMTQTYRILNTLLVLLVSASFLFGQETANAGNGKELFKNLCAQCHSKDMKTKATGPALGGVEERWAEYPKEELYAWIRNSQASIAAGQPRAVELWNEWKPTVMSNFPALSDGDMEDLLLYINNMYTAGCAEPPCAVADIAVAEEVVEETSPWFYVMLIGLLAALALILTRITSNLNYIADAKEGVVRQRRTLTDILTSRSVIAFAAFSLVIVLGATAVDKAVSVGRQQGYAPEQPIKYSHVTHSGVHKIDCQYCHSGARRSKHSVIPGLNTCMNCHKAIQYGSKYGTAELTKIYVAAGYNPYTDNYIENYDDMSADSIMILFKNWIEDNYRERNPDKPDSEVERVVNEQWDDIYDALVDKDNPHDRLQGPVEWVRIHNLPDHVYFNHAQHVTVGQVECQQCHGTVEEYEVMRQYSTLSMGWCINCHRQTAVQFESNDYYQNYYKVYQQELQNGIKENVKVEDIGGIECQKCHY